MTTQPLNAARFDALTRATVAHHPRDDHIIWTAKLIGARIGRSETWVRKVLAREPGGPVHRTRTGQLYAEERALLAHFNIAA